MKLHDTKAVARFLDLSERRVRQLRDKRIILEVRPNLYDLMDTNRRYINYLRQRNPESKECVDYNTERALYMRAKRKNEELNLMLKENQLHSTEDVQLVLSTMLIHFRSRLMAMPSKLAPVLGKKTDKAEIFKIIKGQVDEALNELSDFDTLFVEKGEGEDEKNDD